jgi:hypothetical protein
VEAKELVRLAKRKEISPILRGIWTNVNEHDPVEAAKCVVRAKRVFGLSVACMLFLFIGLCTYVFSVPDAQIEGISTRGSVAIGIAAVAVVIAGYWHSEKRDDFDECGAGTFGEYLDQFQRWSGHGLRDIACMGRTELEVLAESILIAKAEEIVELERTTDMNAAPKKTQERHSQLSQEFKKRYDALSALSLVTALYNYFFAKAEKKLVDEARR